jgi:hypothetical protein
VVEAGQGVEALLGDVGGVAHRDERVGVGRVAGDEDLDVVGGDLVERGALAGEDLAVGGEQVGAVHALLARHGADEHGGVHAVEDLAPGRRRSDDIGQGRERAVVELHDDALERLEGGRDLEQPQLDRGVRAEQRTAGDAEEQAVADLTGSAGDGHLDGGGAHVSTAYDGADRRLWVVRDLLAQDRDGNVWWCGREVSGRPPAGMESSEANDGFGLWMPRALRLGDGFVVRPGQEIANVAETGVAVKTWMADFEGAVELRVDVSGRSESRAYVEGVGLVARSGGLWGDWSLRARAR